MSNAILQVKGMSCSHCIQAVEDALKYIGAKGSVDLQKQSVEVQYDAEKITLSEIKEAIEEQGYDVQ